MVTYVYLNAKVLKDEYTLRTKIFDSIKNYVHYGKKLATPGGVGVGLKKHSDDCVLLKIELIYIV